MKKEEDKENKQNEESQDFKSALKEIEEKSKFDTDKIEIKEENEENDDNMNYKIKVNIVLTLDFDQKQHLLDCTLFFRADLKRILKQKGPDLSTIEETLEIELSEEEKEAVKSQIEKPKTIGILDKFIINKMDFGEDDKEKINLNQDAPIIFTKTKDNLTASFESVFVTQSSDASLIKLIPSKEKMEKHIIFDVENINEKIEFSWMEINDTTLTIRGDAQIETPK